MKCGNVKRGWEEANSRHEDLSRGSIHLVLVRHKATPTPRCWSTLDTRHEVSSGTLLDLPQRLAKSPRSSWSRFPQKSFSMKDGGLHVPCTKPLTPLHTKPEGQRHAGEPPRLQGGRCTEIQEWFTLDPAHKAQHLALSLSQELILALTLTKLVLSLRIWSLSTLVGLEVFFNVYGPGLPQL